MEAIAFECDIACRFVVTRSAIDWPKRGVAARSRRTSRVSVTRDSFGVFTMPGEHGGV